MRKTTTIATINKSIQMKLKTLAIITSQKICRDLKVVTTCRITSLHVKIVPITLSKLQTQMDLPIIQGHNQETRRKRMMIMRTIGMKKVRTTAMVTSKNRRLSKIIIILNNKVKKIHKIAMKRRKKTALIVKMRRKMKMSLMI